MKQFLIVAIIGFTFSTVSFANSSACGNAIGVGKHEKTASIVKVSQNTTVREQVRTHNGPGVDGYRKN